jgi:hypothetical protein
MDEWIRQAIKYSDGACWNNGSWGVRNMRGSTICQYMPQGEQLTCHIAKQRNTQTQTVKIRWHSSGLLPLTQTRLALNAYLITYLNRTGAAGAVIVNAGANTRSQPFTVHQAATGYI